MKALRRWLGRILGARRPMLQVGAVCLDPDSGRVLMITSRGTGRWIVPKGWPIPGLTLAQAALAEAWEEAGVRAADAVEIGRYDYGKVQDEGFPVPVEVHVFLLRVDELADDYPELGQRRRCWMTLSEAADSVDEPGLAGLLRSDVARIAAAAQA